VIVGENRAGKSNLVYALRLILDGRLSYTDRQLGAEDFWDGLFTGEPDWDPMSQGHVIEASIEVVDFRLLAGGDGTHTTVVTTQSPHIAGVTDPRRLVVLRNVDGATVASQARDANLTTVEWDDITRYLDATRAELVFARKVLLVEGFAEQVLMPQLARALDIDLDKERITAGDRGSRSGR
jgi:predicted ATP-dependent endonuclease of OLD family